MDNLPTHQLPKVQ